MSQRDDTQVLKEIKQAKKEPWDEMEGKQERLKNLHKKVGQIQAFSWTKITSRLAAAKIIKEIHNLKAYKDEFNTFEEFCQHHFGVGRQAFYDDFKILQHLAEEFCRSGDKIGLLYSDIRRIARLEAKELCATGDKIITIEGAPYEIIPENKKAIEEALAELEMKLDAEKRRADGFKKMADNRAAKTEKLERDLKYIKNPYPNKSEIESIIDKADTNITLGLAQLCSTVRMLMAKEKETGENAPERPLVLGLMGKTKFALMEAIETAERDLGELSELEIREGYKKMGMPLPKKNPEE